MQRRVMTILLPLLLGLCLTCGDVAAAEPLEILAGTTLIQDIVTDLGGDRPGLSVRVIIPAGACPGHFDLKTSDCAALATAKAILLHDWQAGQSMIQGLLDAVPGARAKVAVPAVQGNWMLPERQEAAARAIAAILSGLDPDHAPVYAARLDRRLERIAATAAALRELASGMQNTPVLAEAMQGPFLTWLGLRVAATYGRFEETGPESLARALAIANEAGARLVVDNLQSTGEAGRSLAGELHAAHVVLTNFPGVHDGEAAWEDAVTGNVRRLRQALGLP